MQLVLTAFAAIQARQPRAQLVLVGDGPLRLALQEACPQAHFAGVRKGEDLAAHYASADLFLFPSLTETFGNVVPEALASGLAVLSYAHAAALELIQHQHNGLLIANGDEQAFVAAAVELALDALRQQQLRQRAPHSVSHLAWSAVADRFEAVLREVLARHGRLFSAAPSLAPQTDSFPAAQERLAHTHLGPLH